MNKTVSKSVRLTEDMAARIDAARGDVSWSRWVERVLERALAPQWVPPPDLSPAQKVEVGQVRNYYSGHLPTCRCPVCKPPK